jgi:hypothetical protein
MAEICLFDDDKEEEQNDPELHLLNLFSSESFTNKLVTIIGERALDALSEFDNPRKRGAVDTNADGELPANTQDDAPDDVGNLDGIGNAPVPLYGTTTCVLLLHSTIVNLNECFEFLRRRCRNYDNLLERKMTFSPKNFVELPVKKLSVQMSRF